MTAPHFHDDRTTIYHGDCQQILTELAENSLDACVTDPPYGISFMSQKWDEPGRMLGQVAQGKEQHGAFAYGGSHSRGLHDNDPRKFQEWCFQWGQEVLRVLKPGAFCLSFGATRTFHRLICALEDAGFEIIDQIDWIYGSGMPKSNEIGKQFQKRGDTENAERWAGWATTLKPAHEPILVARKPFSGTALNNLKENGVGAMHIDACRIPFTSPGDEQESKNKNRHGDFGTKQGGNAVYGDYSHTGDGVRRNYDAPGRWPANVIIASSQAKEIDAQSGVSKSTTDTHLTKKNTGSWFAGKEHQRTSRGDVGGASRFFQKIDDSTDDNDPILQKLSEIPPFYYSGKAAPKERPVGPDGTKHPTVKPVALLRYLIRLVVPTGGTVLEPFAGSGATIEAALLEQDKVVGIELMEKYLPLIQQRIDRVPKSEPDLFDSLENNN